MPLKHSTETILVCALAFVSLLTGIAVALLPPLPSGLVPALLLLGLTLAYAGSLYPLLRRYRSEYALRLLHFAPAAILLAWLAIQIIVFRVPQFLPLHHAFTWGWTFPAVFLVFILLIGFCLHVLRRRVPRLSILVPSVIAFTILAAVSERHPAWRRGFSAAVFPSSSLSNGIAGAGQSSSSSSTRPIAVRPPGKPFFQEQSSSSRPSRLPAAGPGLDLLFLTSLAVSCAAAHGRGKRKNAVRWESTRARATGLW